MNKQIDRMNQKMMPSDEVVLDLKNKINQPKSNRFTRQILVLASLVLLLIIPTYLLNQKSMSLENLIEKSSTIILVEDGEIKSVLKGELGSVSDHKEEKSSPVLMFLSKGEVLAELTVYDYDEGFENAEKQDNFESPTSENLVVEYDGKIIRLQEITEQIKPK